MLIVTGVPAKAAASPGLIATRANASTVIRALANSARRDRLSVNGFVVEFTVLPSIFVITV